MKTIAIIQARMGSTRLPGKVLMDIAGKSMLARVVERIQYVPGLSEVVVATTKRSEDDRIIEESRSVGVATYRGSEHDVLDRYYQAAKEYNADIVIRVTADCPLIDPSVSHEILRQFKEKRPDYASNTLRRTYPRGLDTEVFGIECLTLAWLEAKQSHEREHVTPYIYENPHRFELLPVLSGVDENYDMLRWTVDTEADLEFVRELYTRYQGENIPSWRELLRILELEPHLRKINQHIRQKPVGRVST